MGQLNTQNIRKNAPLKKLWSADEARTVKKFVRDLRVQTWNMPQTEVDYEKAVIYIPSAPDTVSPLYVAVDSAVDGDSQKSYEGGTQDEERQYIELRRVNSDGKWQINDNQGNPIDSKIFQVMPPAQEPEEE
jgi:hypothetical protein